MTAEAAAAAAGGTAGPAATENPETSPELRPATIRRVTVYDAIVVGAGPAGSTAAYRLASAGASVLLLDRARFPRDKPCGGGVTGRAAKVLPF